MEDVYLALQDYGHPRPRTLIDLRTDRAQQCLDVRPLDGAGDRVPVDGFKRLAMLGFHGRKVPQCDTTINAKSWCPLLPPDLEAGAASFPGTRTLLGRGAGALSGTLRRSVVERFPDGDVEAAVCWAKGK